MLYNRSDSFLVINIKFLISKSYVILIFIIYVIFVSDMYVSGYDVYFIFSMIYDIRIW